MAEPRDEGVTGPQVRPVEPREGAVDVEGPQVALRGGGEDVVEGEVGNLWGEALEAEVLEDVSLGPVGVGDGDVAEVREAIGDGGEAEGEPDADRAVVASEGPVDSPVGIEGEGAAGLACNTVYLGGEEVKGTFWRRGLSNESEEGVWVVMASGVGIARGDTGAEGEPGAVDKDDILQQGRSEL